MRERERKIFNFTIKITKLIDHLNLCCKLRRDHHHLTLATIVKNNVGRALLRPSLPLSISLGPQSLCHLRPMVWKGYTAVASQTSTCLWISCDLWKANSALGAGGSSSWESIPASSQGLVAAASLRTTLWEDFSIWEFCHHKSSQNAAIND